MSDVSWSWEADLKDGLLEAFMANVVAPWNATAEADEDTLLNYWVVDEAKTCVKVYQRFTSSAAALAQFTTCLLYTSPSPRDGLLSRMPSSA